jgi:hypothetical protein
VPEFSLGESFIDDRCPLPLDLEANNANARIDLEPFHSEPTPSRADLQFDGELLRRNTDNVGGAVANRCRGPMENVTRIDGTLRRQTRAVRIRVEAHRGPVFHDV